jgi:hypothetical protein
LSIFSTLSFTISLASSSFAQNQNIFPSAAKSHPIKGIFDKKSNNREIASPIQLLAKFNHSPAIFSIHSLLVISFNFQSIFATSCFTSSVQVGNLFEI